MKKYHIKGCQGHEKYAFYTHQRTMEQRKNIGYIYTFYNENVISCNCIKPGIRNNCLKYMFLWDLLNPDLSIRLSEREV